MEQRLDEQGRGDNEHECNGQFSDDEYVTQAAIRKADRTPSSRDDARELEGRSEAEEYRRADGHGRREDKGSRVDVEFNETGEAFRDHALKGRQTPSCVYEDRTRTGGREQQVLG